MLKAIVQQEEVRLELFPGCQPRRITTGPGIDCHSGQGPSQPESLFPDFRRAVIEAFAVGKPGGGLDSTAVAPAKDGHAFPPVSPEPG
jgi:hypothetical protein